MSGQELSPASVTEEWSRLHMKLLKLWAVRLKLSLRQYTHRILISSHRLRGIHILLKAKLHSRISQNGKPPNQ